MVDKFEVYKDQKDEFRWRLRAANGQEFACSGQGYKSKESAKAGIEAVKKNAATAVVEDQTI